MSSSDLQAIFSNLRPRSVQGRSSASPAPSQPTRDTLSPHSTSIQASSPAAEPSVSSTAENSVATSRQPANATAQNLLSLLNFKGSSSVSEPTTNPSSFQQTNSFTTQNSAVPQRDLPALSKQAELLQKSGSKEISDVEHSTTHANALSDLLNTRGQSTSPSPAFSKGLDSNSQVMSKVTSVVASPVPTAGPSETKPLFTYTNPFAALNASRVQTPKSEPTENPIHSAAPENNQTTGFSSPADVASRKKLTPKPRSSRNETSPQRELAQSSDVHNVTGSKPEVHTTQPMNPLEKEMPIGGVDGALKNTRSSGKTTVDITGNVNSDEGSGEWEDSDEVSTQRVVPVYNFPIKAFVSMSLQLDAKSDVAIRQGSIMEISRLKKDFDQIDRSLAAATNKYIGYAFTKHGGLRIIRQDDGSDRHVFKNTHDRIFNVAFCTTSVTGTPTQTQGILGTGVSGAVYYATISKEGNDFFEEDRLDTESLICPPWSQADDNTAGGILKTRAKRSSRHPEFFAIGRGRFIHIIWPSIAMSEAYGVSQIDRTVDVEKLYEHRPVRIETGKAGKDFTFSEDDTCIVSLDKTGRLRFWDLRRLLEDSGSAASHSNPLVVDRPILSLSTVSATEKSWPTSVLFVDKARPYNKGGPLRYVLVGLRQNHTLQLWDIALNKAVQELNFPHESETDGICSVCYHPASGIVVVGHPTRNSIFFIHLSAPKYTLSSHLGQASYVTLIANKDSGIPHPDSTACFSGIREIPFAEKGELRSVELLPIQKVSDSGKAADSPKDGSESAVLFELYVAHSKGVTCLNINREDLGWNSDNKAIQGIDAKKEGLVKVRDLKLGGVIEEPARSKSPAREVQQQSKSSKKKAKKAAHVAEEVLQSGEDTQHSLHEPTKLAEPKTATGIEQVNLPIPKESKKSKKKSTQNTEPISSELEARSLSPVKSILTQTKTSEEVIMQDVQIDLRPSSPSDFLKKEFGRIEKTVSDEFRKEFTRLQENISADRTALDQASLTRQEAIIRLVSSSLSTNVENSLSRIVMQKIQSDVLPALLQATSTQISDMLGQQLQLIVSREIGRSFESPSNNSLSDAISRRLSGQIEKQVSGVITGAIAPIVQNVAHSAAEQTATTLQAQLGGQLQQLQSEHTADRMKIDRLNQALQGMADTLQAMSDSQVAFQEQILRDRQHFGVSQQTSTIKTSPLTTVVAQPTPIRPKSKAEMEIEEVSAIMEQGRYEEGTIKWLQSAQPIELFDQIFVRFTPDYLATEVSPLVAFSVAVTVANALDRNIERRIEWISTAFDAVDASDPEMSDLSAHAPALISAIVQKLESLYMTIAERQHDDPILKMIPSLVKKARGIRSLFLPKD